MLTKKKKKCILHYKIYTIKLLIKKIIIIIERKYNTI